MKTKSQIPLIIPFEGTLKEFLLIVLLGGILSIGAIFIFDLDTLIDINNFIYDNYLFIIIIFFIIGGTAILIEKILKDNKKINGWIQTEHEIFFAHPETIEIIKKHNKIETTFSIPLFDEKVVLNCSYTGNRALTQKEIETELHDIIMDYETIKDISKMSKKTERGYSFLEIPKINLKARFRNKKNNLTNVEYKKNKIIKKDKFKCYIIVSRKINTFSH